eukprot:2944054-Rhodomonas_salina.1
MADYFRFFAVPPGEDNDIGVWMGGRAYTSKGDAERGLWCGAGEGGKGKGRRGGVCVCVGERARNGTGKGGGVGE